MPVQIGTAAHAFSDPTGLLSDCHRRIEMFLGALSAVAKEIGPPLSEEARQALDAALRYFRESAPKHVADEEESLFPRLRQIGDPEIKSALDRLETLESDHQWAAALHATVETLGQQCLSKGSLSPEEAQVFRSAVASLASMYERHIAIEDREVFPMAARLLSATDRKAVGDEMAARRKVRRIAEIPQLRGPR